MKERKGNKVVTKNRNKWGGLYFIERGGIQ